MSKPKLHLSVPQSDAFWSEFKSNLVVAGFGSGKTKSSLVNIFDSLDQFPGVPQGYAAPTYGLIKDIFYPAVEDHCAEYGIKYHIQRSDHVINIEGMGKIVCRSMSNPDKIVGFEVGDFHLDEMDILKKENALNAWRKCKARCRFKFPKKRIRRPFGKRTKKMRKPNQMFAYTTPEGFKAAHHLFVKEPLKNSTIIKMSTYSNIKNLPDDYIDELMANYPPQLIAAYIMGDFVNLVNMPVWMCYDRTRCHSTEYVRKTDPLIIGMDFNVGRGCAVVYVERLMMPTDPRHPNHRLFVELTKKGHSTSQIQPIPTLHAVGEVYNSYDTIDTIRVLKERYPKSMMTVYPDASGDNRKSVNATISDIALLRDQGFIVKANPSNPNIKDRVQATNAMMYNANYITRLFVNAMLCPNLADSLEQQVYDKNGLPEKGDGKFDDMTDAASYPIAYLFPIKKPISTRTELIL